jgi:uncharacterized membrane protein
MKTYQIIFWILKILAVALLILIYSGYIDTSNSLYQFVDKLLKIFVGIFIIIIFTFYSFPMIDFHDVIIIQISGYLLLYSAFL